MKILDRNFYNSDTVKVAKNLIGKILVREVDGIKLTGIITETEAYTNLDPASHSFIGKTERNKAMYGQNGHAYIYFTYGNHFCLNAVAKDSNIQAGGVLIRAIKPLEGIEYMQKSRGINSLKNLTNGPGKLAQALIINKDLYGIDLTKKGPLYITEGISVADNQILITPRIGISKAIDYPWRFIYHID